MITRRRLSHTFTIAFLLTPSVSAAQSTGKVARLAVVHPLAPVAMLTSSGSPRYKALFAQLSRLGYVEGRNLQVDRWSAEGRANRFAEVAREVVRTRPDVIFTTTTPLGKAFQAETRTVPIVAITADPVAMGLATSLARSGGNVTGVSIDPGLEILGKRIQLLRELVPSARRLGYLAREGSWEQPDGLYLREICARIGLTLVNTAISAPFDEAAYRNAFAAMAGGSVDSLCIAAQAENTVHQRLIAQLALQARLATVFDSADNVEAGGLMSYGIDFSDTYGKVADLIASILAGTNPDQLPFFLPTKFEFSLNVKTARQLAIAVPPSLIARADNLID